MASLTRYVSYLFSELVSGQKFKDPSTEDVLCVKQILECYLPLELIDNIIDYAEYWPHSTAIRPGNETQVRGGSNDLHENIFMLRSFPLGFVEGPHDQIDYQMTDQYRKEFTTLLPQTWGGVKEIPNNATEEVLKAWTTASKPRTERPCRKIVFTIVSHDQGWGGRPLKHDPYKGSFTWFDVGKEELSAFREVSNMEASQTAPSPQFRLYDGPNSLKSGQIQNRNTKEGSELVCSVRTVHPPTIPNDGRSYGIGDTALNNIHTLPFPGTEEVRYKFEHPLLPTDDVLQKNVANDLEYKTHVITWSYNDNIQPESLEGDELDLQGRGRNTSRGDFVRDMKLGDCVTVWAKARFGGWANVIQKVQIDVYWAV